MRVIAGEARGRPLQGPKGKATRPTSDLMREVMFSMLEARGVAFSRVLDLYAGTGALGIEALSRGADFVEFVDRDRGACATIRSNLERTGFAGRGRVVCAPLPAGLSRVQGPYSLVLCDPPYTDPGFETALRLIADGGILTASTTFVYEHHRRTMPPETCGPLPRQVTRRHGDTGVSLYYAGDAPLDP